MLVRKLLTDSISRLVIALAFEKVSLDHVHAATSNQCQRFSGGILGLLDALLDDEESNQDWNDSEHPQGDQNLCLNT
ncbi:MAG: hypothetical protein ACK4NQ_05955 [Fimbriimonadaceae bacterium]